MTATIPQLRMGFTRFDTVQPPQPEAGYGLRTYRPGDEDAWIAMLNTGSFGVWDRARLDEFLSGKRGTVPRESIYFATMGDAPVGSACLVLKVKEDGSTLPEVGWVVVDPRHQGHHLALHLCRAVLEDIRDRGYEYAYLLTEDFRPAAIKTYLRLGFVPEMIDPVHPAWWAETQRTLMDDAAPS
jgi:mycothiol synthase